MRKCTNILVNMYACAYVGLFHRTHTFALFIPFYLAMLTKWVIPFISHSSHPFCTIFMQTICKSQFNLRTLCGFIDVRSKYFINMYFHNLLILLKCATKMTFEIKFIYSSLHHLFLTYVTMRSVDLIN